MLINHGMSLYTFPMCKQTDLVTSVKVQRLQCVYSMDRGKVVGVCVCVCLRRVGVEVGMGP